MAVMVRTNGYWVGIAEILVTPATGLVRVTNFILGVECGKIINPRQLDRCMKGGVVMGLGEALKEEVTFDKAKVTSTDWSRYKILTMEETPEIKIIQISRDDKGFGVGGEAPNALPPGGCSILRCNGCDASADSVEPGIRNDIIALTVKVSVHLQETR